MPRTCSRMKLSASPKPARGPVFGLTWPILIARLCAFTGITLSTAGAAMAPRPVVTRVRREILDFSVDFCVIGVLRRMMRALRVARLLEILQHLRSQLGLLLGRPAAETFARLHAELAILDELLEIGRRAGPLVDRRQHGFVDRQRKIGADQV